MVSRTLFTVILIGIVTALLLTGCFEKNITVTTKGDQRLINLPQPDTNGRLPLEQTIKQRRSRRYFSNASLTQQELGQILWAAQGITGSKGHRSAPSAFGSYPITLYVMVANVDGIAQGVYQYFPELHAMKRILNGNAHREITMATPGQAWYNDAAAIIIIAGNFNKIPVYAQRHKQEFVIMETGCIAENIYLQCESYGLATTLIGIPNRGDRLNVSLQLDKNDLTLALMPVSHPSSKNKE